MSLANFASSNCLQIVVALAVVGAIVAVAAFAISFVS